MSRTTIVMIASFIGLIGVVALLPAQESSRRTAKNRSSYQPATPERPNLSPMATEPDLPPIITPPSRTTTAQEQIATQPDTASSDQQAPGILPTDTASRNELDDSRLHSVLKRSRPAPSEFSPPPTSPSGTAAGAAGTAESPQSQALPANEPPVFQPPTTPEISGLARRPTFSTTAPKGASSTTSRATTGATNSARPTQNLTATSKNAALKVDIAGPSGVTVGKPAPYLVNVSNESDTTAEEVLVRIALPSWVSVQATQPSTGEAGVQGDAQGSSRLVWSVPRIAGRGREQLKLQIVTREGDGFDLTAEWTCKPAAARAAIIVKQPQLALTLAGPADMTFGEEKTFTLTVSNPGSGDAERVVISVAAANSPPQQFDAGTIPAGHKKEVPLAVVASQAGAIELAVTASGEGGLEARTLGKITVRKAEVSVAIDGPPMKFSGSEATYVVAVTNSGTAAADNINLSLALPNGARYIAGIEGATAAASTVKWKISSLAPGGERQYEVRVQLSAPGTNRLALHSQATSSGTSTSTTETEVEAVSDLKLVVNDPAGPTPTGEQAVYELQVVNRGSQAAKQVKIIMQFADGVEPISFEGCEARIVPGQVLCQPLAQLGPGEQATLRVKAKAEQAGSHHFRVEVTTADGEARLVSEGTTRFFAESGRGGAAASTAKRPSLVPGPSVPTIVR